MAKQLLPLLIVVISFVLCPAPALAHSVQTDYQVVADALEVQSTFSTGEALEGAMVNIFSPHDETKPWLQGTTDTEGKFSFQPDREIVGEWSVKIGQGDHGDILTVPVTAQGIDEQEISAAPHDAPHWWAKQMTVAGVFLTSSLGTTWWIRWRRKQ